jgi:aryl-alcohol dehydrogenase-like predicted oxidoreductase
MTLSRRDLLKLGLGAGLTAAVTRSRPLFAFEHQDLILRTIPSSGVKVPGVGIGGRNYRGGPDAPEMAEFRATIETFHRLGGKLIDTSPNYGNSEEILGGIMRDLGVRNDLFIATKVDQRERDAGIQRMERSFTLLGGDTIDLMQVHNMIATDVQLETMKAWKERGRFRHIGVTTSSERQYADVEATMKKHRLDFIQVDFSLGNREAAERLLPLAADQGVAVLTNLPFGRGRMFTAVREQALPPWAADIDATTWAQVLLKYIMSAPGTVIPIPGTTKPHHAEDNLGAARGRLPDANLRREMERFIDPLL